MSDTPETEASRIETERRGDDSRDDIYKLYHKKRKAERAHLGEPPSNWEDFAELDSEARFKALWALIEQLKDDLDRSEAGLQEDLADIAIEMEKHVTNKVAHLQPWQLRERDPASPNYAYPDALAINNAPFHPGFRYRIERMACDYNLHTLGDLRKLRDEEILAPYGLGRACLKNIRTILDAIRD